MREERKREKRKASFVYRQGWFEKEEGTAYACKGMLALAQEDIQQDATTQRMNLHVHVFLLLLLLLLLLLQYYPPECQSAPTRSPFMLPYLLGLFSLFDPFL